MSGEDGETTLDCDFSWIIENNREGKGYVNKGLHVVNGFNSSKNMSTDFQHRIKNFVRF
jgi:hypothetical protein